MKQIILFFTFAICFSTFGQISNFKTKFDLPEEVKETSGLLLINGKIVTHNDSGDIANLYEIDSLSGNLTRSINVSNATNVDWEDLAEDNTHIYVGDIGNNSGDRTDLKIYKILKTDYLADISVTAEIINFSYEDQTDFTTRPNANNFDAEAFVIYQNSIFIFTKNWTNLQTNVYKIPNVAGTYSAEKVSTGNVQVLITGAAYDLNSDTFFLTSYDTNANPFLIYIDKNRMPGDDVFFSGFNKLTVEIEQGSQIEGITNFGNGNYYISREFVSVMQGGMTFTFSQRLYEFLDNTFYLLGVDNNKNNFDFSIAPNPVKDKLYISKKNNQGLISGIKIFSILGKEISKIQITYDNSLIDVAELKNGIYLIKITFDNQQTVTKRFIKL